MRAQNLPVLRKAAGIREVAKLAGVSTATVSRTINGSSKVVHDTANRVRWAMKTLDFSPNSFAQGLAHHKRVANEMNNKSSQ